MNAKDYLLLFVIALVPFIAYLFNPLLSGADSYFYINQVCRITPQSNYTYFFSSLIQLFPCNIVVFKAFLFSMWFGCIIFMAKITELYDKERGVLGGLIMAGMTLFVLSFFNFENDVVGYFLFFASFYFLLKYDKEKSKIALVLSLVLIILSGLFWSGAIYWLMIYPIFFIWFLPMFVYLLFLNANYTTFLFFLNADRNIAEHTPFIAVLYWGMTVLFLYGIKKMDKKLAVSFLILAIPALFVVKLYVLCIPFVVLFAFHAIKDLKLDKQTVFYSLIMFALIGGAFFGMKTTEGFPTVSDIEVIKMAIDNNIYTQNTFGAGYAIVHHGGIPSSAGQTDGNDYICSGYVIENTFKIDCNCPVLLEGSSILLEKC